MGRWFALVLVVCSIIDSLPNLKNEKASQVSKKWVKKQDEKLPYMQTHVSRRNIGLLSV
jgi:hypothetical protein